MNRKGIAIINRAAICKGFIPPSIARLCSRLEMPPSHYSEDSPAKWYWLQNNTKVVDMLLAMYLTEL